MSETEATWGTRADATARMLQNHQGRGNQLNWKVITEEHWARYATLRARLSFFRLVEPGDMPSEALMALENQLSRQVKPAIYKLVNRADKRFSLGELVQQNVNVKSAFARLQVQMLQYQESIQPDQPQSPLTAWVYEQTENTLD
jgi:hypothetical protein